jgi:hypothetical protein
MKIAKLSLLGVKSETTQNTAVSLAATDFMLAEVAEPEVVPSFQERNYAHASLDPLPHVVTQVYKQVKIKVEDKGVLASAGTAYAPLDALLKACGMSSTASAGVSVTYAPISLAPSNMHGPATSCTIEVYRGIGATGLKYLIKGAVAKECKYVVEAGKPGYWEFTMAGLYTAVADGAAPATTFNTGLPPTLGNTASFTIHSYAATVSKIEIDFGLSTTMRPDANSSYGVLGFAITGRSPKGSIDPEAETVATHGFYSRMLAGTEGALAFVVGSAAGNITTFALPKAQYAGVKEGNRDGILMFDVPLKFNQSTGDDWISIVKT